MSNRAFDGNNYLRRYFDTQGAFALDEMIMNSQKGDVWVFDAKNSRQRRKDVYPDYKAKRQSAPDDFYRVLQIWKEILQHLPVLTIEVPTYEADDVIWNMFKDTKDPTEINSTDGDYQQFDNPMITLTSNPKGIEPRFVRLYKTLVGDPSDNISGIAGFGAKTWDKVTEANKLYLINNFNARQTPIYALMELSAKLTDWCNANHALLQAYWDIVGFFDLSVDEIVPHLKAGKKDFSAIAEIYEKEGIITMTKWSTYEAVSGLI